MISLAIPSLFGGLFGAVILVITPEATFKLVVPFLVLFATLVLASRDVLFRRFSGNVGVEEHVTRAASMWGVLFQFFVATYGGYFGAGIGILMLGSFSLMGLRDIHKMNAIKTPLSTITNVTAFVFFAFRGLVVWQLALIVAVGTITGGYVGARLAKRVNSRFLHFFIVIVGLLVSGWFFAKSF